LGSKLGSKLGSGLNWGQAWYSGISLEIGVRLGILSLAIYLAWRVNSFKLWQDDKDFTHLLQHTM